MVTQVDIFDAAAAKEHHGVFLQVVSHAGDVGGNFHAVRQTDAGNLADSGVRLARGLGRYFRADASLKRRVEIHRPILQDIKALGERRSLALARSLKSLAFNELVDGRHDFKKNPNATRIYE